MGRLGRNADRKAARKMWGILPGYRLWMINGFDTREMKTREEVLEAWNYYDGKVNIGTIDNLPKPSSMQEVTRQDGYISDFYEKPEMYQKNNPCPDSRWSWQTLHPER